MHKLKQPAVIAGIIVVIAVAALVATRPTGQDAAGMAAQRKAYLDKQKKDAQPTWYEQQEAAGTVKSSGLSDQQIAAEEQARAEKKAAAEQALALKRLKEIKKERKAQDIEIGDNASITTQAGKKMQHSLNATVATRDHIDDASVDRAMPVQEPNWDEPVELRYRDLVKMYYYFLKHHHYPEGAPEMLNGAAVIVNGAVMPIETPNKKGELSRFWLANQTVVMAGCVFCNPPTMADLVYVEKAGKPLRVDREALYKSVVNMTLKGRFFLGPKTTADGVQYLFGMEFKEMVN